MSAPSHTLSRNSPLWTYTDAVTAVDHAFREQRKVTIAYIGGTTTTYQVSLSTDGSYEVINPLNPSDSSQSRASFFLWLANLTKFTFEVHVTIH